MSELDNMQGHQPEPHHDQDPRTAGGYRPRDVSPDSPDTGGDIEGPGVARDGGETLGESTTASGVGEEEFGVGIGNTQRGADGTGVDLTDQDREWQDLGLEAPETIGDNTGDLTGGGRTDIHDEAIYNGVSDLGDLDEGETIDARVLSGGE
jgi:hypothetical protein